MIDKKHIDIINKLNQQKCIYLIGEKYLVQMTVKNKAVQVGYDIDLNVDWMLKG